MITIIGAGKVGSQVAFNVLARRFTDVVLIDSAPDLARGQALDMMQSSPAIEFDGKIKGTKDFREMGGSELVIITAGIGMQPGMSRLDLVAENSKIIKSIAGNVAKYAPDCRKIVFLSDRSGGENVWVCDPDGSNPQPVTKGRGAAPQLFVSPS